MPDTDCEKDHEIIWKMFEDYESGEMNQEDVKEIMQLLLKNQIAVLQVKAEA